MARQPRHDLAGIPQHVVQRGNNRLPCFLDDTDRRCYLHLLGEALLDTRCVLHTYVLMDNHVHLLVMPPEAGAISRLMQKLGRGYAGQFNARHRRTGTLWEGRYKACLVDSERYVLCCHRYIDLNPVRARMTDDPVAYDWSSAPAHCGRRTDSLLRPHPAYTVLASTLKARADTYRHLLYEAITDEDLQEIRAYLQQQRAWGRDGFRAMVEAKPTASPASGQPIAHHATPRTPVSAPDPVWFRTYLQQQRAWGRDNFRAMVEAKTQRFAGIRPAHRPPRDPTNARK